MKIVPFSGADENPPVFARRWRLADDGFGLQRDASGNYVHIDDALSVLHATIELYEKICEEAARYRFIRSHSYVELWCDSPRVEGWTEVSFDMVVDEAIAEQNELDAQLQVHS